jgi:hypothetical protein
VNAAGRPWKIPPEQLEPHLRKLREQERLSLKVIAQRLGYSVDHLRKLCVKFRILLRLKPQTDVDDSNNFDGRSKVRDGGLIDSTPVAASDSALSNSPKSGTST